MLQCISLDTIETSVLISYTRGRYQCIIALPLSLIGSSFCNSIASTLTNTSS